MDPLRLAAVVRSTDWKVFTTTDNKLYFVNKKSQGVFVWQCVLVHVSLMCVKWDTYIRT